MVSRPHVAKASMEKALTNYCKKVLGVNKDYISAKMGVELHLLARVLAVHLLALVQVQRTPVAEPAVEPTFHGNHAKPAVQVFLMER